MQSKLRKCVTHCLIALIIFTTSWSLFRSDFFRFHDFTQGARIVEMTNALQDAHFPVIWSANLGYGYGMPLFEFYAPLPYYIGSLFYILGFSLINSIKAIIFIPSFFTAIGAYFLGKKLFGNLGGLLTSAAITLAPYRAVNLFVRGAVSEAWGIMFLPFILLGIIKVIKNEKYGWVLLVSSIFGLLISHNLTALIFLPLSVLFGAGYLFLEARASKKIKKQFLSIVIKITGIYALAVILSSIYSIPAILEKNFTRLDSTILAEYFDFKLHFVGIRQFFVENWGFGGSTYGPMDEISFYLGFGQLIGLFLSGYILVKSVINSVRKQEKLKLQRNTILYTGLITLLVTSLFMTNNRSLPIWSVVTPLSYLQFPWRYLSAAIIFLGLAVGSLTTILQNKILRYGYAFILIAVLLIGNANYFQPEEFSSNLDEYYYSDVNKLRSQMSDTLPDYIPIQINQDKIRPIALDGHVMYCQALQSCKFEFEILEDKVNKKVVRVQLEKDGNIVFAIADFPGWTTFIDGQKIPHQQSPEGFVQVEVNAGNHEIRLELLNSDIRRIANLISIFGLLVFAYIFFWYHKKQNDR